MFLLSLLIIKESILAILLSRQIATLVYTYGDENWGHILVRTLYHILVLLTLCNARYRGIEHVYWCSICMRVTGIIAACVLLHYMPYSADLVDKRLNYAIIIVTNQVPRIGPFMRAFVYKRLPKLDK